MAKRYLSTITKEEALRRIVAAIGPMTEEEQVRAPDAASRVTSRPVIAARSNPPFTSAAMDGYAVSFEETLEADLASPVMLTLGGSAVRVNTGDPMPGGANAVIMVEDVEERGAQIAIRKAASLWQHVRLTGEDIIEGDMLFPVNYRLGILDIGLLLAAGIKELPVRKRPRLLIVPTGSELVDIYDREAGSVLPHKLIDFNSYTLMALGEEMGFAVTKAEIARDNGHLRAILDAHLPGHDVIVINAGSSAGTEDFTEGLIRESGSLLFHGVAMMPGKPAMFGIIGGKPVFGIPGYPVSAVVSFRAFLKAAYERLCSAYTSEWAIECTTPYHLPSSIGVEEVLRVRLVAKDNRYYAYPLPRGAGIFSSLSRADGLVTIPGNVEGYAAGATVRAALLRPEDELAKRINIVGSHDLSLDVLRDMIKTLFPALDLVSAHVGSLSGIMAMQKGVTDLVTTHILDEREKVYNIPAIKKYLPGRAVSLVHIAKRTQGLLVGKGNPKAITGVADLGREDVRFVNRQSGSGTRILLDMMLKEKGIDPRSIRGYDREEATHTAAAILVKEGVADTGLAIYGVSRIFGLDFISLMEEEYDLLVAGEFRTDAKFAILMELLASAAFAARLGALGGYDTKESGKIKYAQG